MGTRGGGLAAVAACAVGKPDVPTADLAALPSRPGSSGGTQQPLGEQHRRHPCHQELHRRALRVRTRCGCLTGVSAGQLPGDQAQRGVRPAHPHGDCDWLWRGAAARQLLGAGGPGGVDGGRTGAVLDDDPAVALAAHAHGGHAGRVRTRQGERPPHLRTARNPQQDRQPRATETAADSGAGSVGIPQRGLHLPARGRGATEPRFHCQSGRDDRHCRGHGCRKIHAHQAAAAALRSHPRAGAAGRD